MMEIYVGNLPFDLAEDALRELFTPFGEVGSVQLIADRHTGKPRGFGFVEMLNDSQAQAAIAELEGRELSGRKLKVNQAMDRGDRGSRGGENRPKRW